MHSPPRTPVSSRIGVFSWALWDWGSASFNAVIITFVFTPYLTKAVASSEESGSAALGWSMAAAGLVIALVAPAVGTRADAGGRHKLWLGVHTGIVIVTMAGLFFVRDSPAYLWLGLLLIAVGSVFFEFAEVAYNGIMVRITTPDNVGKVSGFGWGMGYAGGLVLLVLLLARLTPPERAGENFGLYATTGRAVSFLGPAMFALFISLLGYQRAGTLGIIIVLIIGLALIIAVKSDAPQRSMAAMAKE